MRTDLRQELTKIPNQLTAVRLLLIPVLWVFALQGNSLFVGVGLVIAFLTDGFDGLIARQLRQTTEFGAKFDSLADNLLTPSAVIWLVMLRPEIFRDHPTISIVTAAIYLSSISVGLIKFRRFGNLHLYSSKMGGAIEYAFIIHSLLIGGYNELLFFATIGMLIISSTETLALQLTQSRVDEHIGSIIFLYFKNKT